MRLVAALVGVIIILISPAPADAAPALRTPPVAPAASGADSALPAASGAGSVARE
ncbi:hypothetical protein [Micromonospora sp. NPDC005367]|uniref:hypothetical protein n=1 Tax=Micromonospora sp. NPDC005367 TaxID=3155590 RepID=UPI0033A0F02E